MRLLDKLPARFGVSFKYEGVRATFRSHGRGAKPRGPAADDEKIGFFHTTVPFPRCVSTRIPSLSSVMQVFTLETPSTTIMHEEQLPMAQ